MSWGERTNKSNKSPMQKPFLFYFSMAFNVNAGNCTTKKKVGEQRDRRKRNLKKGGKVRQNKRKQKCRNQEKQETEERIARGKGGKHKADMGTVTASVKTGWQKSLQRYFSIFVGAERVTLEVVMSWEKVPAPARALVPNSCEVRSRGSSGPCPTARSQPPSPPAHSLPTHQPHTAQPLLGTRGTLCTQTRTHESRVKPAAKAVQSILF